MNVADLLEFLAAFGTFIGDTGYNAAYDFDSSGAITSADLLEFLAQFDPFSGGLKLGKGGK